MRWILPILAIPVWLLHGSTPLRAELRVGAARMDVTPVQFPVLVNGGVLSRTVTKVKTKLHARAIVLDDGRERVGIVVVDSCMMPRAFLDEAKKRAAQVTKIQPNRMLISATHTHSAPASMSCLGTDMDPTYVPFLREKLAQALVAAESRLEPARVGWAVANAAEFTALRRWIRRPDRMAQDPFGNPTVRANMHAGRNWDDVTGESGPEDPDLSLISFQAPDGQPIAVLANFSMHYFAGEQGLSADYFGLFSEGLESNLAHEEGGHARFVGIMSHGCSGDIWRRDYKTKATDRKEPNIERYSRDLVNVALKAYAAIKYDQDADLAMAETRLKMKYRVPDAQRLAWAERVVAAMGNRLPKDNTEVYAREQLILHQWQTTEIVVQALRIGKLAIATTPTETYALTGLKIKLQSPLPDTMVIELANGGDGYVPPPEQHFLGGYNTWEARSAGLEVQAEPRITEAALAQLEKVANKPRRSYRQPPGRACQTLLAAKPIAYWRADEFNGPFARDSASSHHDAVYERGVVFFLKGPRSSAFCSAAETNRAAHFAGGRLRARVADLGPKYSVSLWFWNGMPTDARPVSGWMFSRGQNHNQDARGEHLGLGGGSNHAGKLIFRQSEHSSPQLSGHTPIARWTWNHVVFVRDESEVRIYLNGQSPAEIKGRVKPAAVVYEQLFFGGRCDNQFNWEGRLDEMAVFDRVLSEAEIKRLHISPAAK